MKLANGLFSFHIGIMNQHQVTISTKILQILFFTINMNCQLRRLQSTCYIIIYVTKMYNIIIIIYKYNIDILLS